MLMLRSDSADLFAKEIPHEWGDFVSFDQGFAVCETACEYRPRPPEESVPYGGGVGHPALMPSQSSGKRLPSVIASYPPRDPPTKYACLGAEP
jgi:hypothetical protein